MAEGRFIAGHSVYGESNLPRFEYLNYAVTRPTSLTLNIAQQGRYYDMKMVDFGGRPYKTATIRLTSHDLGRLNKRLRNKMEAIISDDVQEQAYNPQELEDTLRPLAEEGYTAFSTVFRDSGAYKTIHKAMAMGPMLIQINSEDFVLPWELMLSKDPNKQPRYYKHFWGIKHIVYRPMTEPIEMGDFVPSLITYDSRLRIGLACDEQLTNVVQRERPFFEQLEDDGKITLVKLPTLQSDKKQAGITAFKDFWDDTFHVAHFACHAVCYEGEPDRSYIRVSDNFCVTMADIVNERVQIEGHPLLIINACEAGDLNPLYSSHFVQQFEPRGPRGIVATECQMPDTFAAHFTEQLYGRLLDEGCELGESMRATRWYFLRKCNNPTGLLYSMYASPDIRFLRVQGRNESP